MSGYKLIAFDMDGTLLNSEKKISSETLKAIEKAFDKGKEVVFCTGRCIAELKEYIEQIPRLRYIVGVSGALVYDLKEEKEIYLEEIPKEQVRYMVDVIETEDIMPQMLNHDSIVSKKDSLNMDHFQMGKYTPLFEKVATKVDNIYEYYKQNEIPVIKLNLYHTTPENRQKTRDRLEKLGLELVNAETTSLEISAEGITKGTGLEKLAKHLGITMNEMIAVGDADNDIDVLSKVGLSIAMENANEKVKSICDVVVNDCDSNGCAEAIEKYLLG